MVRPADNAQSQEVSSAVRAALLARAIAATSRAQATAQPAAARRGPLPAVLGRLCRQALPLDPQRRRECVVWIALTAAAAPHPELAAEHGKALHVLIGLITQAIAAARAAGQLDPAVDPPAAAAVLAAVLDGLTLHGITGNRTPAALTATLDAAIAMVLRKDPSCLAADEWRRGEPRSGRFYSAVIAFPALGVGLSLADHLSSTRPNRHTARAMSQEATNSPTMP